MTPRQTFDGGFSVESHFQATKSLEQNKEDESDHRKIVDAFKKSAKVVMVLASEMPGSYVDFLVLGRQESLSMEQLRKFVRDVIGNAKVVAAIVSDIPNIWSLMVEIYKPI